MSRVSLDSMFRVSGFEVWAFSMCRFGFLRSGSVLFDWFCFFAGERVLVRVGGGARNIQLMALPTSRCNTA